MPLTKPLTEFKAAKVKGYVHWSVEDWSEIQRIAREMNVPNHWVIMAMKKFATSDNTELEFMNRLDDLIKEVRSEMGLPDVQKGTNLYKICKWCGLKDRRWRYMEEHENYHCSKRPLEVLLVD